MPENTNQNVPSPPENVESSGFPYGTVMENVYEGANRFATGLTNTLNVTGRASPRIKVTTDDILKMERLLSQKYPQWDKKELRKYLLTVAQLVPNLYMSPYAVEEIIKKAFNYGGIDPLMLMQYSNLMAKGL